MERQPIPQDSYEPVIEQFKQIQDAIVVFERPTVPLPTNILPNTYIRSMDLITQCKDLDMKELLMRRQYEILQAFDKDDHTQLFQYYEARKQL